MNHARVQLTLRGTLLPGVGRHHLSHAALSNTNDTTNNNKNDTNNNNGNAIMNILINIITIIIIIIITIIIIIIIISEDFVCFTRCLQCHGSP